MSNLTERRHDGGFIVSEANGTRSRAEGTVTVLAGERYAPGTPVNLSAGKYILSTNAGVNDADALTIFELDNTDGAGDTDFETALLVRDAEVNQDELNLIYNNTGVVTAVTAGANTTAAIAQLATLGIIARDAV